MSEKLPRGHAYELIKLTAEKFAEEEDVAEEENHGGE